MDTGPPQTHTAHPTTPPGNLFTPPLTPSTTAAAATHNLQIVSDLGLPTQDTTVISMAIFNRPSAVNILGNLTKGKEPRIKFPLSELETIIALSAHLKHILSSDSTLCALACNLSEWITELSQDLNGHIDGITIALTLGSTATTVPLHPFSSYADAAPQGVHHPAWPQNRHPKCNRPHIVPTPSPSSNPAETQLLLVQNNPKKLAFNNTDPKLIIQKLQDAISEVAITNNGHRIRIRAVRVLASKDISVTLHNKSETDLLHNDTTWVPKASTNLKLCQEVFPIIVHRVPTSFDPTSKADTRKLREDNPNALGSLKQVCWVNAKKAQGEGKQLLPLIR
ncbi:hypothetical protein FRB95_012045 [Tulasnella sp. JGI-2019a]|nr:hypothetical protein FRB95_012045 [Tulasnella sp. JGI-2019a]